MEETEPELTRHARNRVRRIGRRHPQVTVETLLASLPGGETLGYDDRGDRRARIRLGSVSLIAVIDEEDQVVITVWVE